MTTVRDIIEGAGKLLGVIRKGEPMSADEIQDGLQTLNDMIDSWSNESLIIYSRTNDGPFTLTGASSYSIGPSQTFNTVKPIVILKAYVRLSGGLDFPLTMITDEQYQDIQLKSQAGIGWFLNYNNGNPYGTIRIWPLDGADQLFLLSEKQISTFTSVNDTVTLPVGWNKALKYNLSLDMAPEYSIEPDPLVVLGARESKANIKKGVSKNRLLTYDVGDMFWKPNIYNGWFTS